MCFLLPKIFKVMTGLAKKRWYRLNNAHIWGCIARFGLDMGRIFDRAPQ